MRKYKSIAQFKTKLEKSDKEKEEDEDAEGD